MATRIPWADHSNDLGRMWRVLLNFLPSTGKIEHLHMKAIVEHYLENAELTKLPGFVRVYEPIYDYSNGPDWKYWVQDILMHCEYALKRLSVAELILERHRKVISQQLNRLLKENRVRLRAPSTSLRTFLCDQSFPLVSGESFVQVWAFQDWDSNLIDRIVHDKEIVDVLVQMEFVDRDRKGKRKNFDSDRRGRSLDDLDSDFFAHLMRPLIRVLELEMFREVAYRTWGTLKEEERYWTSEQLTFINGYYRQVGRVILDTREPIKRPFKTEIHFPVHLIHDDTPPVDLRDLESFDDFISKLLQYAVFDFIKELIYSNLHEAVGGSAKCDACGQYFQKSFYGHDHKYCSETCRQRANKRKQRERKKLQPLSRRLMKTGQDK